MLISTNTKATLSFSSTCSGTMICRKCAAGRKKPGPVSPSCFNHTVTDLPKVCPTGQKTWTCKPHTFQSYSHILLPIAIALVCSAYPALPSAALPCPPLYCPALYCSAIPCNLALYCSALYCPALPSPVLPCPPLSPLQPAAISRQASTPKKQAPRGVHPVNKRAHQCFGPRAREAE